MKITHEKLFNDEQIKKIEGFLTAQYIGDGPVPSTDGGWVNANFAIFHTVDPNYKEKGHTEFVACGYNHNNILVKVGLPDFDPVIDAIRLYDPDELVYSTRRWDYAVDSLGRASIDGGRDYSIIGTLKEDVAYKVVKFNMLTKEIK